MTQDALHEAAAEFAAKKWEKLYSPLYNATSCTKCDSNGQVYYIGSFSRYCSRCIEKDLEQKFNKLLEEVKKFESLRIDKT